MDNIHLIMDNFKLFKITKKDKAKNQLMNGKIDLKLKKNHNLEYVA